MECKATNILTSPLVTAGFPFSKIFFPYLSDPSGEIHLLAMTPASSTKSGTRPADPRLTHTHTHTLTCTPVA